VQVIPAPKFKHGRKGPPDSIGIHWSAGSGDEVAIGRYFQRSPHKEASYHRGIGRAGGTAQYVADGDTAWHAGDGESWDGGRRVNDRSIGIVLALLGPVNKAWATAHPGRALETPHRKRGVKSRLWERPTPEQVTALRRMIAELKAAHPTIRYIFGHDDVTKHKIDPGPILDGVDLGLGALGLTRIVRRWDLPGAPWEGLDAAPQTTPAPEPPAAGVAPSATVVPLGSWPLSVAIVAPALAAPLCEPPAPEDAERVEVVADRNAVDLAPAPAAAPSRPRAEGQATHQRRARKPTKPDEK
jgi:hypothetical protein